MSSAAATSRPSPRSSWSFSGSSSRHPASPSPPSFTGRASSSVGQSLPPRMSPAAHTPRHSTFPRSSSPSYFGLVVEHSTDPEESVKNSYAEKNWSAPSSTIRSPSQFVPKIIAPDLDSDSVLLNGISDPRHGAQDGAARIASHAVSGQGSMSLESPSAIDSDDRMQIDSAYHSGHSSQKPSQSEDVVFAGVPRFDSPQAMLDDSIQGQQSHLTRIDDRHPRLSLPGMMLEPPSPSLNFQDPAHRSATLPSTVEGDGPTMVLPHDLANIIQTVPTRLLLLDLRVFPQYSHSRIAGALNLCIPTTLLKRASFDLKKLADTFTNPDERQKFETWKDCDYLVVYDEKSRSINDASSCVNTLKKFGQEGWSGSALLLNGGFHDFQKAYPTLIDAGKGSKPVSLSSKKSLSIDPPNTGFAPLAGGCPMPTSNNVANPFFGNIRQNTDLIDGVGQMPVQRPSRLDSRTEAALPLWVSDAVQEADKGKKISERFLAIEKEEQRRMQEALSGIVSYGPAPAGVARPVQIAGIEKGEKNRYNNIWPYDHARVRLQGCNENACDYVNASFVSTSWSRKKYIATQAPIPATFDDFWRMVWEQDVRVLVMLTAEKEGPQIKCHNYWSERAYGPLKLRPLSDRKVPIDYSKSPRPGMVKRRSTNPIPSTQSSLASTPVANPVETQPHVIVRKFALTHNAYPFARLREITQIQYNLWPDFGAPTHPMHVLGLVEQCDIAVRSSTSAAPASPPEEVEAAKHRPILVHCSAGCGRTGTFCTIDSVIDMLKQQRSARFAAGMASFNAPLTSAAKSSTSDTSGSVAQNGDWLLRNDIDLITKTVEEFRDQRLSMVQSLRQFVLCYETVLEWLLDQHLPSTMMKEEARRITVNGITL